MEQRENKCEMVGLNSPMLIITVNVSTNAPIKRQRLTD